MFFNIQLVLLSQTTGSVSSGNLSALTSVAAKHAEFQAMILLPLERGKVAHGSSIFMSKTLSSKLIHASTQLIIVVKDFY